MQDLIIVGDSWGCGAWSSPQGMHMTPDDYFSKYFSKNYKVTNLSKGAKSNKNSLENLIDFLVNSDSTVLPLYLHYYIRKCR